MRARSALFAGTLLIAAAGGAPACVTDHDALAKKDGRGGAGAGGSAASAGFPPVSGGAAAGGTGGRVPDEHPGADVLTIVNGIVDAASVRLCFRAPDEEGARSVEAPEGAEELAYAASLIVHELSAVDLSVDALEPFVIAGELDLVSELPCDEALEVAAAEQASAAPAAEGGSSGEGGSGGEGGVVEPPAPPRLRTAALPILPAGTLARGRSTLLALNGCIGGPAFAGTDAALACGASYSTRTPTLGAVWVNLSRRAEFGKLGLQVVQASLASETVSLASKRIAKSSEPSVGIVSSVAYGTIAPRVPSFALASGDYGANTDLFLVEAIATLPEPASERWRAIRERAGIDRLEDGRSYALVVVGPSIGLGDGGFWNAPAFALVENDPAPPDPQ